MAEDREFEHYLRQFRLRPAPPLPKRRSRRAWLYVLPVAAVVFFALIVPNWWNKASLQKSSGPTAESFARSEQLRTTRRHLRVGLLSRLGGQQLDSVLDDVDKLVLPDLDRSSGALRAVAATNRDF